MTKLTKKRFVISKSLIGKNVTIEFTTKKGTFEYNHDDVYSIVTFFPIRDFEITNLFLVNLVIII